MSRAAWRPGASHPFYKLWKQAVAQGWRTEIARSNHVRWISPHGGVVMAALTPSDHRAVKAHLTLLRRYGFDRNAA